MQQRNYIANSSISLKALWLK